MVGVVVVVGVSKCVVGVIALLVRCGDEGLGNYSGCGVALKCSVARSSGGCCGLLSLQDSGYHNNSAMRLSYDVGIDLVALARLA